MPKYRHLTKEELDALQKEFVEFLVVNGITADKWSAIKENKKESAEEIIEQFSDVVWEGALRKAKFLELRNPKELLTFQCLPDKLVLMGMKVKDADVDITTKSGFEKLKQDQLETTFYTSEKKYFKKREEELFEMIQNGCEIADGALFKRIALAIAQKK
ncbi:MAG: hypothetical protein COA32_01600 [Fluviicola sp.]|nr:MAG: hypothetical protein COA32_01600 [Fluviicola sp.]